MFDGCRALETADVSGFVVSGTTDMRYWFNNCYNLISVHLPRNITFIDDYAFNYCYYLNDVFYAGSPEQWELITIDQGNGYLQSAEIHYNCRPIVITVQPASIEVIDGETAVFSVAADGYVSNYRWQSAAKDSNVMIDCPWTMEGYGTAAISMYAYPAIDGYTYRCILRDYKGNEVISDIATLTVYPKATITSQPQSCTVQDGDTATFTIEAQGKGLTYQWQYKIAGSNTWRNSSTSTMGYNTPELEIIGTLARDGYQYRCVVTDEQGNKATSVGVMLQVTERIFEITANPENQTVEEGEAAYFSVTDRKSVV